MNQIYWQCSLSDGFTTWLAQSGGALALTTYQAGRVFLITSDGQRNAIQMSHFSSAMGLAVSGPRLALATRFELWLFANAPLLAAHLTENQPVGCNALYLPRARYYTGEISAHDVAFASAGLVFVNTRFSCLCQLSQEFNFMPIWQPRFIDELSPQDRCHLNGLALVEGCPKYVTALGATNTEGGWRTNKAAGGILMEVDSKETVLRGLSMPHSPRWHDGKLWLLNSGKGELLQVDPHTGQMTVVCVLPGYLRGLCFVGPYAVIGMSYIREKHLFAGLPVQQSFPKLLCGAALVDLRSGQPAGQLEFTAGFQELYDVQFLPGVCQPILLDSDQAAIRQAISAPGIAYWLLPKEADASPATESGRSPATNPEGATNVATPS